MFENLSPNMRAAIFTAVVGALGGIGTWVYNIGYNNGARDIADIKAFHDKLPTLIDDLDRISKSVSVTVGMIDENKHLKEQVAKDVADLAQLEGQLRDQAASLAAEKNA